MDMLDVKNCGARLHNNMVVKSSHDSLFVDNYSFN